MKLSLSISDLDMNSNEKVKDTISVHISSETDPSGFTINLKETENNTGIFRGTFGFSNSASDSKNSIIKVFGGDTIYVVYQETKPENTHYLKRLWLSKSTGGQNVSSEAYLTLDRNAPTTPGIKGKRYLVWGDLEGTDYIYLRIYSKNFVSTKALAFSIEWNNEHFEIENLANDFSGFNAEYETNIYGSFYTPYRTYATGTTNKINIFGVIPSPTSNNGLIAIIKFKIKSTSTRNGEALFKLTNLELKDSNDFTDQFSFNVEAGCLDDLTDLDNDKKNIPQYFVLYQNYPNPFNPKTTIQFKTSKSSFVTLTIYSTNGQRVKTLLAEQIQQGLYNATWNGTDDLGRTVSSGIYIYTLKTNTGFMQSRKMLFIK